jgi:hypothetical protein
MPKLKKKHIRILALILSICATYYIYQRRENSYTNVDGNILTSKNTCDPINIKQIDSILHKENKYFENKVQNHVKWCKLAYPQTSIIVSINNGNFATIKDSLNIKETPFEEHTYKEKTIYIETSHSDKDISGKASIMGNSDTFIIVSASPVISKDQMLKISKYIVEIE